jgi:flagellar biosynthesis anti-sigma factor FlgM
MKITDSTPYVNLDAYTQMTRDRVSLNREETSAGATPCAADKVVLSPRARQIQEATSQLQAIPDVAEEKVARIRSEVEGGTYRVDGGKIAEKMLQEMANYLAP